MLSIFQRTTKTADLSHTTPMNTTYTDPENDLFVTDIKRLTIVISFNGSFYRVQGEAISRSNNTAKVWVDTIRLSDKDGNVIKWFNMLWTNDALLQEARNAATAHVEKNIFPTHAVTPVLN